jgi:hypothetical protein
MPAERPDTCRPCGTDRLHHSIISLDHQAQGCATSQSSWAHYLHHLVELPGIEPATEIALTWVDVEFDYAKRRETTCGYAKGVDGVNTWAAYSHTQD